MKNSFIFLLLSLCFPILGLASEAYEYASAAIHAFDIVNKATSTPVKNYTGKIDILMRNSVAQSSAFASARAQIYPFVASKDPEIAGSAEAFSAALSSLQLISDQTTVICENLLNNPKEVLNAPGTAMRKIFELEEQAKLNWEIYDIIGAGITWALIDSTKIGNGTLRYLRLVHAEREQLKSQLITAFGQSIENGANKNTSPNKLPAVLLWAFLNDTWESAAIK